MNSSNPQLEALFPIIQEKLQGKYIVLEGLDGSGKTTLKDSLETKLTNTFSVREPGSTDFGESIRNILLSSPFKLQSLTEFFLFMASRNELLNQKVIPALKENKIVISDRSYISSYAYQAYPAQISVDYFNQTVEQIYATTKIDLIIYVDVPYKVGLDRSSAVRDKDNMEAKGDSFYAQTEAGYKQYLDNFKSTATRIENLAYLDSNTRGFVELYKNDKGTYLAVLNAEQSFTTVYLTLVQTLASLEF
ncbi:dTMP kinase [Psittacicella hinzii]|uniref:Thymidylate kinase n=1 Tax=Psittacicella hinzii TaxID=2028575 RepID=A0A3A1Y4I1_9GAMM|nr:dTMP kinase [Psittacicella hinzii]RIY33212.1 dTMP kinase [Psittacicella hinzii]